MHAALTQADHLRILSAVWMESGVRTPYIKMAAGAGAGKQQPRLAGRSMGPTWTGQRRMAASPGHLAAALLAAAQDRNTHQQECLSLVRKSARMG